MSVEEQLSALMDKYTQLQAENKQLEKERDFAKKIADMYVTELGLTVKRIKQNLKGFEQPLNKS